MYVNDPSSQLPKPDLDVFGDYFTFMESITGFGYIIPNTSPTPSPPTIRHVSKVKIPQTENRITPFAEKLLNAGINLVNGGDLGDRVIEVHDHSESSDDTL